MSAAELRWRTKAAARATIERCGATVAPPHWRRTSLLPLLASDRSLADVRAALGAHDWLDAHRALSTRIAGAPQRFLIAPALRPALTPRVVSEFPKAAREARARADRILAGEYDLLGYKKLRFDPLTWHRDPVNGREAPRRFWSRVPYLDPAHGDHKVIWELNRHQHWLTLGRAYWLTGDRRFRAACTAQLASWLSENPPLIGINWASMLELAFRSLSWLWAIHFFAEADTDDDSPWLLDLFTALHRQLLHVERNLSYYFSPNTHLAGEALALYVAGRVIGEFRSSARWQQLGRSLLVAEATHQISSDGGHCERSAHYHRYMLDFYLLALAVARITGDDIDTIAAFERAAGRLAFAARVLADERGRLPQLGDDDGGTLFPLCGRAPDDARDSFAVAAALVDRPDLRVGPAPEEAFWLLAHPALAARLDRSRAAAPADAIPSTALPDTGYFISRSSTGDHLVLDAGPHGFQNGGHAHADALAMTLTLRGIPLLIDPGTACYTVNPGLRDRFRSSQMHNTLTLDDRSQSEPSGPFHWARTASASLGRWRTNGGFDYFDAAHDGYAPLVHRRHVLAVHDDLIVVADLIDGPVAAGETHRAAVHWHFDPRWTVDANGRRARLSAGSERADLMTAPGASLERFAADAETGLGWCAPVYGRIEPTSAIRVERRGETPLWIVSVFGLNGDSPIDAVEHLPVWSEAGVLASWIGVRIVRRSATDYLLIAHPHDERDGSWRLGDIETDARMLFCRVRDDRQVIRTALVDGSFVRAAARRLEIVLPRTAPDLHVDLGGVRTSDPFAATEARISGPGFGARVVVGGRELPVALERRSAPRPQARVT